MKSHLRVVVVGRAVLVLDILTPCREERQRVEGLVSGLVATGNETTVVEELRREVNDSIVRAIVLTQQDATGMLRVVDIVQPLQE